MSERTDAERLDWLNACKHFSSEPANHHVARYKARVNFDWMLEGDHLRRCAANSVREAIDMAMGEQR